MGEIVRRSRQSAGARKANQPLAQEMSELGFELIAPFAPGPIGQRYTVRARDERELVVDAVARSPEHVTGLLCQNSCRMKNRTDGDRVAKVIAAGWLEDASYYQITTLDPSASSLAEVASQERWTELDFWLSARDLLLGLAHLHHREIVHGAITPWTVYQSVHGVVIGDYWWVHNIECNALYEDFTEYYYDGLPASFLPFIAPEVLRGGFPNRASDMFSLGALLFFIMAGVPPRRINPFLPQNHSLEELCLAWADAKRLPMKNYRSKLDPVITGIIEILLSESPNDRVDAIHMEAFVEETLQRYPVGASGWNCA